MNDEHKRLHGKTLRSKTYRELYEDPKFGNEVTGNIKSAQVYQLVDQLDVSPHIGNGVQYGSEPEGSPTLYYLWGDERRAVRRIVQSYPEFVGECMDYPKNPLKKAWEEIMWELLVEEWQFAESNEDK